LSSPVFLFVFLPLSLVLLLVAGVVDNALRHRGADARPVVQNLVLLAVSLGFALFGSGWQVGVLVATVVMAFVAGRLVEARANRSVEGSTPRRLGLWLGVGGPLALLAFFKYADDVVAAGNGVLAFMGAPTQAWTALALPLGLSFLVFQATAYVVDVDRGIVKARHHVLDVALFLMLFPRLLAGPVVRLASVDAEIDRRPVSVSDMARGATRFVWGLAKKVMVADACAVVANSVFDLPVGELSTRTAWIGMTAFTLQLTFDVSAYADMAIGLGRMVGFTLPENVRRPLSASSMTDFWHRFHITVSTWFRDVVYLPLGGSRGTTARTVRNLCVVFLVSGLWLGARWTFVVWGLMHAVVMTIERETGTTTAVSFVFGRRVLTFLLVVVTFTVFRADSLLQAGSLMWAAVTPHELGHPLPVSVWEALSHRHVLAMVLASASVFLPGDFVTGRWLTESVGVVVGVARLIILTVLALLALTLVMSEPTIAPFFSRF
jgi:alginate O-acetyltransferase complex protein AlgI